MSFLLTIEGLDGTGKSTLAKELQVRMASISKFNKWCYQTKEPGLYTRVLNAEFDRPGVDVRSIVLKDKQLTAMERELLFYVDASQHRRFIENQGSAIVISDRGLWSHFAYLYATMKMKQMDYDAYKACIKIINLTCAKPDAYVYLRGDLALMGDRLQNKPKDVIESNGTAFFDYVLDRYEDLVMATPYKCLILDAKNSTSQNVDTIVDWLLKEHKNADLTPGNPEVC